MEVEETEVIELDAGRYIQLEKYRQWPRLGVLWSVRHRVGESDYPVHRGSEESVPTTGQGPDEVWNTLRETALAAANSAAEVDVSSARQRKRPSLIARILGRE